MWLFQTSIVFCECLKILICRDAFDRFWIIKMFYLALSSIENDFYKRSSF